jgi:membrane-bound ClpP family serine protease
MTRFTFFFEVNYENELIGSGVLNNTATMDWAIIIGLILAGILLLVLEVLVVPGVGVVGFFGFGLIVYSIWIAFAHHGVAAGVFTTIATFFASAVVIWISLQSKTWKRISLNTDINARSDVNNPEGLSVGDMGRTSGRIAPMGKALVNNKYYEVRSASGWIDQDKEVKVTRIDGNQIYVKEVQQITTN